MANPNIERSFADRLNRGRTMQAGIAGFIPPFEPQDTNLSPASFESYLNGVEAANDSVSDAETILSPLTDDRVAAADALKDKALRVKDHVGANVVWKKYVKSVGTAADKVRGYAVPRRAPVLPPGTVAPPPVPARQGARSQQGFADLEKLFGKLIAQVQKVVGYTAAAGSGLTVAALQAQDVAFSDLNSAVTEAEAVLGEAQRGRKDFYDGENGLRDKMKAIKKAVRAQYGSASAESEAVAGIAL